MNLTKKTGCRVSFNLFSIIARNFAGLSGSLLNLKRLINDGKGDKVVLGEYTFDINLCI